MKKGFTLIELLVVIAIIGILSGIVLTSLNSARTKAKEGRVQASMSQIRVIAETVYDGSVYDNIAAAPGYAELTSDITLQGGTLYQLDGDNTANYAAEVKLPQSGLFFCIDSTGKAKTSATSKGDTATACP